MTLQELVWNLSRKQRTSVFMALSEDQLYLFEQALHERLGERLIAPAPPPDPKATKVVCPIPQIVASLNDEQLNGVITAIYSDLERFRSLLANIIINVAAPIIEKCKTEKRTLKEILDLLEGYEGLYLLPLVINASRAVGESGE